MKSNFPVSCESLEIFSPYPSFPSFAGHRARVGSRKISNTSMPCESGTTKGEENQLWGHMCSTGKQEVSFSSRGHRPKRQTATPAFAKPAPAPLQPRSRSRPPGIRGAARLMEGGAAPRALDVFLLYLACGGRTLPRFSPKEEAADQAESAATRSLGPTEGGSSTRQENSPNKAHRAGRAGEPGRKREDPPRPVTTARG